MPNNPPRTTEPEDNALEDLLTRVRALPPLTDEQCAELGDLLVQIRHGATR